MRRYIQRTEKSKRKEFKEDTTGNILQKIIPG